MKFDTVDGLAKVVPIQKTVCFCGENYESFIFLLQDTFDNIRKSMKVKVSNEEVPIVFSTYEDAFTFMSRFPNKFMNIVPEKVMCGNGCYNTVFLADGLISYFDKKGNMSFYEKEDYLKLNNFPSIIQQCFPVQLMQKYDNTYVLRTINLDPTFEIQINLWLYGFGFAWGLLGLCISKHRKGKLSIGEGKLYDPDNPSETILAITDVFLTGLKRILDVNLENVAKLMKKELMKEEEENER